MPSGGGEQGRKKDIDALVQSARAGKHKSLYLFVGEPFQTTAAARAIIDALVPADRRDFNLETYDGRTTAVARVLDSLRMRGFFAGAKVVWLRETTLFLSGEKRGDLIAALFQAWADGREQEAAEKLLTLVALAGWSQEQFVESHWSSLPKTRLREVCGTDIDAEQLAVLDAVHGACLARGLSVIAFRDDSSSLLEYLEAGASADAVLILTASTVDARKRLYKRAQESGAVVDLTVERERSGALARQSVDDLLEGILRAHGKRLAPAAHDLVVRRAGADTALLAAELEKLCLAVGERPVIGEDDVRRNVLDMAESWIFDFTAALTSRQLARALPLLRGLFEQGEPPLRLLAMIVREVRLLLVARECLEDSLRGKWRADLSYNVFQSRVLPHVDAESNAAFGKSHPFVLYRRFQDAARMSARSLRAAIIKLADLDARLKSSRSDPALLLEAFVIEWCARPAAAR